MFQNVAIVRRVSILAVAMALSTMLVGCGIPGAVLRQQARNAMAAGDADGAVFKLKEAIVKDPADWQSRKLYASILIDQGNALEAQLQLEHALSQQADTPNTPELLDMMAQALYLQGDNAKLGAFLRNTSIKRKTVRDCLREVEYLEKIGDADGVSSAFLRAQEYARPDDATPYVAAARYFAKVGDKERETQALRHAYFIYPKGKWINDRLTALGVTPGPGVGLPPLSGRVYPLGGPEWPKDK